MVGSEAKLQQGDAQESHGVIRWSDTHASVIQPDDSLSMAM
jgi:hypothetical protein